MDVDPPSPSRTRAVAGGGGGGSMTLPHGVVANAPYTGHAPTPPSIIVPLAGSGMFCGWGQPKPRQQVPGGAGQKEEAGRPRQQQKQQQQQKPQTDTWAVLHSGLSMSSIFGISAQTMLMQPSMDNAAVMGLSARQLHQITGSRIQTAEHDADRWTYKMRREAQAVLDFLYLGPSSVARDRDFLRGAGITMLLAARDSRMAEARLLSVGRTAAELGIAVHYVDVLEDRRGELIKALPGVVRTINAHMLEQSATAPEGGRVLVFCETGNERSAAVVAAYILTVFGVNLIEALQFVNACRFCTNFDEETKRMLFNYCEILQAQRDVSSSGDDDGAGGDEDCEFPLSAVPSTLRSTLRSTSPATLSPCNAVPPGSSANSRSRSRPKRRIEETIDAEDDRLEAESDYAPSREPSAEPPRLNLDMARYQARKPFAPFRDVDSPQEPPS